MARVDQPVDIKARPAPEAAAVARAEVGDRFPIVAQGEGWFQIQMFHDSYYLPQQVATELIETPRLPEDETQRKAVFRDLYQAEAEAIRTFERRVLVEARADLDESTKTFMIEAAKLEVCRKSGLSVAGCIAIAFEGADKGWPAR